MNGKATAFPAIRFHSGASQDKVVTPVGGIIVAFTAAAALLTGDAVFISATAGTVNKSATSANYASFAGVVVGGATTNMECNFTTTGLAAASTGQLVLVQISGIARMRAEGTITIGTHPTVICTGTTAGKVIAGTTSGLRLGKPVSDSASGSDVLVLLDHH